jgi:hypothetical protein
MSHYGTSGTRKYILNMSGGAGVRDSTLVLLCLTCNGDPANLAVIHPHAEGLAMALWFVVIRHQVWGAVNRHGFNDLGDVGVRP